jgi:Hsp70 protein
MWYSSQGPLADDQLVAVYDLGGGTFDAAVLRQTSSGFAMLGEPQGIERLGGLDLDEAVFRHVVDTLGLDLDAVDPEDGAVTNGLRRLRVDCTTAKEALSEDTDATIDVALPGRHTQVRLTRAELESMARPQLAETVVALERALAGAGIEAGDLERVLLVGGASRMPLVAEVVAAAVERPVALDPRPKLAVALGAAMTAVRPASEAEPSGVVPVAEIPTAPIAVTSPSVAGSGGADATDPPPAGPRRVFVPDVPTGPPPPGPVAGRGDARPTPPRGTRLDRVSRARRAPAARSSGRRDARVPVLAVVGALVVVVAVAVALTGADRESAGGDPSGETAAPPAPTAPPTTDDMDADGDGDLDLPGAPDGYEQPQPATERVPIVGTAWGHHEEFERIAVRFPAPDDPTAGEAAVGPPDADAVVSSRSGLVRITFPRAPPVAAAGTDEVLEVSRIENSPLGVTVALIAPSDDDAWIELRTQAAVEAVVWRTVSDDGEPSIIIDLVPADGPWATGG